MTEDTLDRLIDHAVIAVHLIVGVAGMVLLWMAGVRLLAWMASWL